MEKLVNFRDYQEQQAADHNNIQTYARASIDHIVDDVVTKSNRYAGFMTVKSAQAEITISPGRFYQAGGAVFNRGSTTVLSVTSYLAAASRRVVVLSAYGQENETDITERDFLINTDTGATEPDAVAMTRSRDAVLTLTSGAESADPQVPPIPASHVAIAYILVDTLQIISVTMVPETSVTSTENLNVRTASLEEFRADTEPRISSLAADLAALANEVAKKGQARDLSILYQDMALVKDLVGRPDDYSLYGADHYLNTSESDITNAAGLGYDAKVEEGIRFPDANADEFEMSVFSAFDPNASQSDGLLLPTFTHLLKMEIGPYHSDLGIAQYGFQTFEAQQLTISRQRIRHGSTYTYCTNSAWWQAGTYDPLTQTFKRGSETFVVLDPDNAMINHRMIRLQQYWVDTYDETYWSTVTTDHTIAGAQVAQSFLVSNDFWLTKLGFYVTAKAANENISLAVCELTNGVPDLSKTVLIQSVPHASILSGAWTEVTVKPTFLKSGKRYAVVLTSNANHRIGMAYGNRYLNGTFFYSTDGAYYQGDLTKDMMLRFYGARFASAQVTIEMSPINLDGGIRSLDILAGVVRPESTDLIFEIQPPAGDWVPVRPENVGALTSAPPLFKFRARFVGTVDMMPGLQIAGSRVSVSRPKTAFKHISINRTLAAPSDEIYRKVLLENFQETPHDFTAKIWTGSVELTASLVEEVALPDLPNVQNRVQRTYKFEPAAPISSFREINIGATNSAASTYHVSESVYWAA